MEHKICPSCCTIKLRSEFRPNLRRSDGLQSYCVECDKQKQHAWYYNNKDKVKTKTKHRNAVGIEYRRCQVMAYLSEHPCVDCGEKDPVVLEFDHVRGRKSFAISVGLRRRFSWVRLKAEIEKCDVRCSNCHKRITARREGWYKIRPVTEPVTGAVCKTDEQGSTPWLAST